MIDEWYKSNNIVYYNKHHDGSLPNWDLCLGYVKELFHIHGFGYSKILDDYLHPFLIALNQAYFSKGIVSITIHNKRVLHNIMTVLEGAGVIDVKMGYKDGLNYSTKVRPSINISNYLVSSPFDIPFPMVGTYDDDGAMVYPPAYINTTPRDEYIGVRYDDDGEYVPHHIIHHKPTRQIITRDHGLQFIKHYNIYALKHSVFVDIGGITQPLNPQLRRIFRQSKVFGKYGCGRLYTLGTNYQNVSKDTVDDHLFARNDIKIDGCDTVELDYDSLHANILLNLNGYESRSDLYDHEDIPRGDMKIVLLIIIGSKSRKGCLKTLMGFGMDKDYVLRLMEVYEGKLSHISHQFYKDNAYELQSIDSGIMIDVLKELKSNDILGLPIHDSVIVCAKYEYKLKQIMKSVYFKKMGHHIEVK